MKTKKPPVSGDLVEVLISDRNLVTGELEHTWKTGVLLEVSTAIEFNSMLWVEVLVGGERIITTPDKIELVS